MMYLDDFVESIETLPQDMKHYFSHMRSLDLRASNTYDVQQKRFRVLCKNAPAMSASEIKKEYMAIKKELGTAFENAEEKVQLAGQTHDMVERQIKRIDAEIKKFQTDLEGSRPGVTEKLIRESLASDPTVNHEEVVAQAPAAPTVTLKRAREREASPLAQPPDGVADADEWRRQHHKKMSSSATRKGAQAMSQATEALVNAGHIPPIPAIVPPPELANDPNEPKYCICNQVSYGDMIGCDNEDCKVEWFHYPCVNISAPAPDEWQCPDCTEASRKKRKRQG